MKVSPPHPTKRRDWRNVVSFPQRGPGRSPGQKRIWCTLELLESHCIINLIHMFYTKAQNWHKLA